MRYSTAMRKHTGKLIALAIVVIVGVVVLSFVLGKRASAPNEQSTGNASAAPEQQTGDDQVEGEGVIPVMPDINTQEFRLTASNVSCSTTNVNGVESRSCSGNVHVVPRGQSDMEPGLYKINEQTRLLHNGVEQDLNSLQQLSQSDVTVRLQLASGSEDTLAEIRY